MEIKDKTKIKINFLGLFNKVKKEFKDDYFKMTFFYLAFYTVMSGILVYGLNYITTGELTFNNLRLELTIVTITFMMTMATMAKKLKDDIVTNYWKLVKSSNKKRPARKKKTTS